MQKLSQRELIEEGFADVLRQVKDKGSEAWQQHGHKVKSTAGHAARNIGSGLKKYAVDTIKQGAKKGSPHLAGIVGSMMGKKSPSSIVKDFPKTFPDVVAEVTDIRESSLNKNLINVSFMLRLLNSANNYEPYDTIIGPINLPFKKVENKGWVHAIDDATEDKIMAVANDQIISNAPLRKSLDKFLGEIHAFQIQQQKEFEQSLNDDEPQPDEATQQDSEQRTSTSKVAPPPLPKEAPSSNKPLITRSRTGSNKRNRRTENEESKKSQKSLLKHLQSMSR